MNKTKIEWCDSTWNPVTGCLDECEYCYARRIATRFGGNALGVNHVLNEPFVTKGKVQPYPFGFVPTFHRYKLNEYTDKKGRNIFVCSMADLFGSWVPDSWIEEVFKACEKAPQHNYLFLTKNPARYVELAEKGILRRSDNMWYGSTGTAMEEYFSSEKTYNTFLSIEPMFSSISPLTIEGIRWIIIGAITGPGSSEYVRPKREWIERIVSFADSEGIPVFMKDSLIPIIGEEKMHRDFPWKGMHTPKSGI